LSEGLYGTFLIPSLPDKVRIKN